MLYVPRQDKMNGTCDGTCEVLKSSWTSDC